MQLFKQEPTVYEDAKASRKLPIDVIYTLQGADATCCIAVNAGLKYGIQSENFSLCKNVDAFSGRHKVYFIDNNYFNYKHKKHLEVVKEFRPKYATVRDIMNKAQCERAGIEYYSIEQILEWAEELNEYAENVIVIPKYDCIKDIPDKYILGYSVPSSHGQTLLNPDLFAGRRIHLLGGSWKDQLKFLVKFKKDVVSLDNNHVQLIANKWGRFTDEFGETKSVREVFDFNINNIRYVAISLSFGAIGYAIQNINKKFETDEIQTSLF